MVDVLLKSFVANPKGVCFEGEDRDEKILYIFRKAVITNVGWLFFGGILFVMPVFFSPYLNGVSESYPNIINERIVFIVNMFWYIFTFGYVFERFLNWFFNIHIITDKRVVDMDFDHLLSRNISEAPLRNIEDITFTMTGTAQTLFNYGCVTVQTAAEKRELEFTDIARPARIQDLLSDLVSKVKSDLNS